MIPSYTYRARVLRVIDGDTFHAEIDLGFDTFQRHTVRLHGLDTPELPSPEGKAAKIRTEELLALAADGEGYIVLQSIKDRREKYGRYLARVPTNAERSWDVAAQLIAEGHGRERWTK